MEFKEIYMERCIQLAEKGVLGAAPNPMVGAVIVWNDQIIGEGYHRQCGGPHAEVNAIRSVKNKELLKDSTIYVSLEPCSHYGKTPPCADLIIEMQIPRVVIGCQDPFAKVAGRGIRKLKDAGIEVIVGVKEKECIQLNKKFITFHQKKRPFITLKWAESADRFMDNIRKPEENRPAFRFSSPASLALVHKRRAEHQAILVGGNTALLDNPTLNVRYWGGKSPLRLVWDSHNNLPKDLHLFDKEIQTIVYTWKENAIPQILDDLYERNIQSLLVEGGSNTLQKFIDLDLWNEIYVEKSPVCLGTGVSAPTYPQHAPFEVEEFQGHHILTWKRMLNDL